MITRRQLALLLLLTGCDGSSPEGSAGEQAVNSEPERIAWYEGDVDEAFIRAREARKPVYLYWGAVWCPPCQEIKHTVFKSKEFLALSKLFIPVYLDGDTERAQAAGERFGVQGYPTMIVFAPDGEEITRIPGGIDISRYNSVLALSLDQMRPTAMLVELARNESGLLTAADFMQLAYYSWGQDFKVLEEDTPISLFRDLSALAAAHDEVASARLYMEYLTAASRKDSEDAPVRIDDAVDRLTGILSSDRLVLACWDYLAYWPEITDILILQGEDLKVLWQNRLLALRHHASLSTAEQLAGWLPLLKFHFDRTDEPLPGPQVKQLQQDLVAADARTANAFARQSVVNQINYIYQQAKLFDDARDLLIAELDRSAAPYYFMSSLGSLAEKQERPDEAVDWYRRAYEASEGAATRFQWGASYVRALIRMKPDDHEKILSTAESVFQEAGPGDEMFTGRNFRVLRSLNRQLAQWQEEAGQDTLKHGFFPQIEALCADQAPGTLEKENCEELVANTAS